MDSINWTSVINHTKNQRFILIDDIPSLTANQKAITNNHDIDIGEYTLHDCKIQDNLETIIFSVDSNDNIINQWKVNG